MEKSDMRVIKKYKKCRKLATELGFDVYTVDNSSMTIVDVNFEQLGNFSSTSIDEVWGFLQGIAVSNPPVNPNRSNR